jgi:hypothetical protein
MTRKSRQARTSTNTGLQTLPGIGPSLAQDLRDLGYRDPSDLHGQNPERMYEDLCELRSQSLDRCVLYAFRCAVHSASGNNADPELRKWWKWKNRTLP